LSPSERFHVLVERDVGLFSLIQQVVSHIPWALQEGRVPVVCFGPGCVYWTRDGFHGASTVWEYYFEPIVDEYPVDALPQDVKCAIAPAQQGAWRVLTGGHVMSSNFGDHPEIASKTLAIPYLWRDPDRETRVQASKIISSCVRPRRYLEEEAARVFDRELAGRRPIGVHARGTDALVDGRAHRRGSLDLARYIKEINRLLRHHPDARLFVASDSQQAVDVLRRSFPGRVVALDAIRDDGTSDAGGRGPQGRLMPSYIANDRTRAAQNGADAVTEYLILSRCDHLVHNGSSMARTVLLANPQLPHTNVHLRNWRVVWMNRTIDRVQSVVARGKPVLRDPHRSYSKLRDAVRAWCGHWSASR
jgi:hypothetical protein